ncbi:hypothetical protein V3I01_00205 [Sphingomonas sp. gentR]|uniref:hypothetical protein n=1 Tax=unclassified Sphingomonas TaxID=196159 RepID=UPI0012EBE20F|nr:hypothetical protein [Sphingomonas sp. LK11]
MADDIQKHAQEALRYWGRKWIDYLALGNGGGLVATASAFVGNAATRKALLPSAWLFFSGLICAGLIVFVRIHWASRPLVFSSPFKKIPLTAWPKISASLQVLACVLFSAAVALALIRLK